MYTLRYNLSDEIKKDSGMIKRERNTYAIAHFDLRPDVAPKDRESVVARCPQFSRQDSNVLLHYLQMIEGLKSTPGSYFECNYRGIGRTAVTRGKFFSPLRFVVKVESEQIISLDDIFDFEALHNFVLTGIYPNNRANGTCIYKPVQEAPKPEEQAGIIPGADARVFAM